MSRWTAIALCVVTGTATLVASRVVERRERVELASRSQAAELRAEHAELQTAAYRRQLGAAPANPAAVQPETARSVADALDNAPLPFEATLSELPQRLALTGDQAAQLRALYVKAWEVEKATIRTGAVPPDADLRMMAEQAKAFLSDEQVRKFAEYERAKAMTEGPKVAEAQARQMKESLDLSDDQVPRVAEALAGLYSSLRATGGTGKSGIDALQDSLRPVLTEEQRTKLARFAMHDVTPPSAARPL